MFDILRLLSYHPLLLGISVPCVNTSRDLDFFDILGLLTYHPLLPGIQLGVNVKTGLLFCQFKILNYHPVYRVYVRRNIHCFDIVRLLSYHPLLLGISVPCVNVRRGLDFFDLLGLLSYHPLLTAIQLGVNVKMGLLFSQFKITKLPSTITKKLSTLCECKEKTTLV